MILARLWPRSLPGQIALLVAVALFVAQAINFAMLYRERQALRFAEITVPSITRVVDAAERLASGRPVSDRPRGHIELVAANPIPPGLTDAEEVEAGLRIGLAEARQPFGTIATGIRAINPHDPVLRRLGPRRADRFARFGSELLIAVELPGRGWLVARSPWPRNERSLIGQLAAQTLVLYFFTLIPILWLSRRIAQPLQSLATSARDFRPGEDAAPVEERGPGDVRAVISAYNALRDRVTAMLDEKDRMLGAIGHDLRTPLSALRVRIESVDDDTDRQRMADIIDEMHRTLEDILSLARLGRPSEAMTDTDLAALVDAVVDDFRDLGHDVVLEEAPRTPIRLRPSLMRRAVRNLIENAVKYGGGSVAVRLIPNDRTIQIEIADRGPGIPADRLDTVFAPFTRLETSRNRETGGVGLGLALAQAIVRDAGGSIRLANRDGGGLLACIELPR